MVQALQNALSGLNSASQQFQTAARTITDSPEVNQTTTSVAENSGNTDLGPDTNTSGQGLPKPPLATDTTAISQEPSLAEGLVSLKEAETAYKSNAAVVSALQDTQDKVLEILA
ncbi:MAG: hypothetical protein ACRBBN_03575 [Methyloligellaceae bacterium]